MRKQHWLFLGAVTLSIIFVGRHKDDQKPVATSVRNAPPEALQEDRPTETASHKELPSRRTPPISATEVKKLRSKFPDQRAVIEEVRQDPHQTPDSLIKFAEALGPLVEKALQNPKDAGVLTSALERCVTDDSVIASARALCLSKAEQLSEAFPELQGQVKEMYESAGADVIDLNERKKSLLK